MTEEVLLIYRMLWGGCEAEFIDGSWGELNADINKNCECPITFQEKEWGINTGVGKKRKE